MNENQIWLAGKIKNEINLTIKNGLKEHYKGEAPYSRCRVQEGYHDTFTLECGRCGFSMSYSDSYYEASELSEDELKEALPLIVKGVEDEFLDEKNLLFFTYKLNLSVKFESEDSPRKFYFENAARKAELKRRLEDYMDEVITRRTAKVKDERELYVFMGHIFDLPLMEYDEFGLIELIEKFELAVQDSKSKHLTHEFKEALTCYLQDWRDDKFMPKFYDICGDDWERTYELKKDFKPQNVSAGELTLFVRAAFWRIKFKSFSWDVKSARKDLESAALIFGSAQAQKYLDCGTGELDESLTRFKDADVECAANDVFAQISVKIKNETPQAYKKALIFIVNLLRAGFAASYAVKFSSKADKIYLPVKGLEKTQTHRFFATALAHEVDLELELYAKEALRHEYEFYADINDEKCLMTGSYAVFGLALKSEKYFALAKRYFKNVDDEHQSAHIKFIETFIDRYGVSAQSLDVLVDAFSSYQEDKIYKNLRALMDEPANKALFLRALENLKGYKKENAAYAAWGRGWEKEISG